MSSDSKRQVAVEFGYAEPLVSYVLSKQDFADAGDLIEYLDYYEDELRREKEEKEEKEECALREETERLYRASHCLICVDSSRTILTLPCCHLTLCSKCRKNCHYCPIPDCKMPILEVISTFLA